MSLSPPMQRITQKTGTSCGVACVAMLARLSYKNTFRVGEALFGAEAWKGTHRTEIWELRDMLAALGWKLGRKVKCEDWSKVPSESLVAVQLKEDAKTWHWVVSNEDMEGPFVFDPNPRVVRTKRRDFKKMPVSWYHRVSPQSNASRSQTSKE